MNLPAEPPRQPFPFTHSPRHATFEFYRRFSQPFFSVCVAIDVTALRPALAALRAQGQAASVTLALHFVALRLAARLPAWRLRLDEAGEPWLYDAVHASTTVLLADGSFGFAHLLHRPRFADFAEAGAPALADARFVPRNGDLALLHCTTLPWLHFTQFSHARQAGSADSCPKLAFGRIDTGADGRARLPLAIDVHHALMDGLAVGEFVAGFEAAMREPASWLAGGELPPV
jgi:chloramphenicol O-acetyltransferase type A